MSISDVHGLAQETFKNAVNALKEVMRRNTGTFLTQIEVPEFDETASIETAAAKIDSSIEQILKAMEKKIQNKSRILGVREILKRSFRASFHFTQVFLTVLKSGSAVNPPTRDSTVR